MMLESGMPSRFTVRYLYGLVSGCWRRVPPDALTSRGHWPYAVSVSLVSGDPAGIGEDLRGS